MLGKMTWLLPAAALCVGCGDSGKVEPGLDNDALMLTEPEAFDIGMDPNFFAADVLSQYPDIKTCHTQGIEFVGDQIFLSCTLFGSNVDRDRYAKSFLLKAKLSEVLGNSGPVTWTKRDITETTVMNGTTLALGHPSGIVYDTARGGIWSAIAVYKALTYTRMTLYSPDTLAPMPDATAVTIEDHIGTIGLIPDGRLMGMNWDSIHLYHVDPRDKSTAADDSITKVTNTLTTAYQDCDTWDSTHIICVGLLKEADGIKYGRLHLLKVDALDTEGVQLIREVPEKLADGTTRVRLGASDQDNTYGTYHFNKALGNEGMAISADKKYAYFFPGDVPGGKLVRYRIVDK
ncbi:DUF6454 family protein [Archangium sp.]|uniref:DUF6454 family protein n=1 Tax=Archangium sp. TaxID=1872627 RepID=UPI002D405B7F|nr:DUF6454 family protein [Archangium sp.]HYO51610.1 DUF6454 family protein [Archangium sp.]